MFGNRLTLHLLLQKNLNLFSPQFLLANSRRKNLKNLAFHYHSSSNNFLPQNSMVLIVYRQMQYQDLGKFQSDNSKSGMGQSHLFVSAKGLYQLVFEFRGVDCLLPSNQSNILMLCMCLSLALLCFVCVCFVMLCYALNVFEFSGVDWLLSCN